MLWALNATDLEKENVFSAVTAVDGQLTRPLLAGDDMQLGRKGRNGDHRLPCYVCARYSQL